MAETDEQFVETMMGALEAQGFYGHDIERLRALASRGAAMQWRPLEEAPKDGTKVLLWNGFQHVGWWDDHRWMWAAEIKDCTHWMLLPSPPAGEPGHE